MTMREEIGPRLRAERQRRAWTLEEVAARLFDLMAADPDEFGRTSMPGVDARMVARWELGSRAPSARYARALGRLYGLAPGELLAAKRAKPASMETMQRRAFLAAAAQLAAAAGMGDLGLTRTHPPDPRSLAELERITRQLSEGRRLMPVAVLQPRAQAHLALVQQMAGHSMAAGARTRIQRVLASTLNLVGRNARLQANMGLALESWREALGLAREAGDQATEAEVLMHIAMSRSGVDMGGRASPTMTLAGLQRAAAASRFEAQTTMHLLALQAEQHALTGDVASALRESNQAMELMARYGPFPETGRSGPNAMPELEAIHGSTLVRAGEHAAAVEVLTASFRAMTAAGRTSWPQAVLVDRAHAYVGMSEPEAAVRDLLSAMELNRLEGTHLHVERVEAILPLLPFPLQSQMEEALTA